MGINPLLSSAIAHGTAYQILAKPVSSSALIPKIESVQLVASSSGTIATQWSISFEQLASSLTRILGKATTAEVLECLRVGQIMRLPGKYNSYEVIRLGYRKPSERITGLKRKAGVR